ncbi:MAG: phosphoribosylformylglycinamidine synthase subunit PurS [bacterium]|nr:MAG: phosphoribosylformylglycinamidine synthase subunit PurS [bacterium]
MKARITISLKNGILDTQGKAVEHSLHSLGFGSISGVRIGRHIEMELDGRSVDSAGKEVEEMCEKLLSNPVTENYQIQIVPDKGKQDG